MELASMMMDQRPPPINPDRRDGCDGLCGALLVIGVIIISALYFTNNNVEGVIHEFEGFTKTCDIPVQINDAEFILRLVLKVNPQGDLDVIQKMLIQPGSPELETQITDKELLTCREFIVSWCAEQLPNVSAAVLEIIPHQEGEYFNDPTRNWRH